MNTGFVRPAIAIVLTACGIETRYTPNCLKKSVPIAIVLTACGIETHEYALYGWWYTHYNCNSTYRLRY